MQHGMRQGKDILQPLFPLQERGCFYFANVKGRNEPSSQTSSRMPCTSIASTDAAESCFQQMGTAAENSYFQMG
ncbi:MAG: hypothetical protein ACFNY0_03955, partial [Selenomonas sp.]